MNRVLVLFACLLAVALASCGGSPVPGEYRLASANQTVVVSPVNPDGWSFFEYSGGTVDFAANPAPLPGGGDDSLLYVAGDYPAGADALNEDYDGVKLADLTQLSYWTYVVDNVNVQAPYLILQVDEDSDGDVDDYLFFEPGYQTGAYSGDPVPDQGDVTLNVWQNWNALIGGWWLSSEGNFGPPLTTLAIYIAAHPNACLRNDANYDALSITAGYGVRMTGHADLLKIGVGGDTTTYNFEITTDSECKKGGWAALGYENQGQCVSAHRNKGQKGKGKGPRQ